MKDIFLYYPSFRAFPISGVFFFEVWRKKKVVVAFARSFSK